MTDRRGAPTDSLMKPSSISRPHLLRAARSLALLGATTLAMAATSGCYYRHTPAPPPPQPLLGVSVQGPQIQTDLGFPQVSLPGVTPGVALPPSPLPAPVEGTSP